jgi:hypothetical protein
LVKKGISCAWVVRRIVEVRSVEARVMVFMVDSALVGGGLNGN